MLWILIPNCSNAARVTSPADEFIDTYPGVLKRAPESVAVNLIMEREDYHLPSACFILTWLPLR